MFIFILEGDMVDKGGYEFDLKFYVISFLAIIFVAGGLYSIKRTFEIARGRDVQEQIKKLNYDSEEKYHQQARQYVNGQLRERYNLTDKEVKKAEDIFYRAFRGRLKTWIGDHIEGEVTPETRRRQNEIWEEHIAEWHEYLRSTGRTP
jgi:hypothetical protein